VGLAESMLFLLVMRAYLALRIIRCVAVDAD
jgi:hypothetical protein